MLNTSHKTAIGITRESEAANVELESRPCQGSGRRALKTIELITVALLAIGFFLLQWLPLICMGGK